MLQPLRQRLDDRCGDRVVNLPNDVNELANLHRGHFRYIETIYFAAKCGLTEPCTVTAGAGPLRDVRRNSFLSTLGLSFHILLDVFVGELLNCAFYCDIRCLPREIHLHFSRLAVQQLIQFLIRKFA
ncbi:hypothetical protein D3C74_319340 [compost metagenome]